jgi:2-dehydro-3-deoxyphosphogalactonate aldolase
MAMKFEDTFAEMPLVAILRGVKSTEVVAIAQALLDTGIKLVEVPMNSPDPLDAISALKVMDGKMLWGAGTVLRAGGVDAVIQAGGRLIVSPNTESAVIRRAIERGGVPMPGFATATDAFCALEAGATHLKLFPASTYGAGHVKALKAVLPSEAVILPVGGVGPANMAEWWEAGARGFGLGSDIYKIGMTAEEVHARGLAAVKAVRALM